MTDRRTRRRYLYGLAAAALAGCSSGGESDGDGTDRESPAATTVDVTDAPTASPEPTERPVPTPAPEGCPSEPRLPETDVDGDELPPVPEQPATLDVDAAVQEYVADYEYAYKYRAMAGYGEGLVEFNLNASVAVTERGPDWVVAASDYAMDHGRRPNGRGPSRSPTRRRPSLGRVQSPQPRRPD